MKYVLLSSSMGFMAYVVASSHSDGITNHILVYVCVYCAVFMQLFAVDEADNYFDGTESEIAHMLHKGACADGHRCWCATR